MATSFHPQHLKRFKDVALLFAKYGRGDLFKDAPLIDDPLEHHPVSSSTPRAEELTKDIERLGPTFIKLGQLLSTRADFLAPAYIEALTRLQDNVAPFPYEEVEAIIAVELGTRISKAFKSFDPEPLAAASLGQVHRAELRSGRLVAVKIQRPRIREQVAEDLDAMQSLAEFLDEHTSLGQTYQFALMIEELRRSLLRELDYRLEAANLRNFAEKLRAFDRIVVPEPIDDYTSGRVLTMDYVAGRKITKLSPLARMDVDGAALAEELFRAYLQQLLVDGIFHADPHPGNVFITDDHRLALIDLGMVARIAPKIQERLLRLLLALSEGKSEEAAKAAIATCQPGPDFDERQFERLLADLIGRERDQNLEKLQLGKIVLEMTRIAGACHLLVPAEFTMLGKTLLNLDLVGRTLDRTFNPNEAIQRNSAEILQKRMVRDLSPHSFLAAMVDAKDLMERLPSRLTQIMELIAGNKLRIKVDSIDEGQLITGMQKIANRITLGLVLAALIIGAAMLMRVETRFQLFGYPGFAILFFLAATCGALALVIGILLSDRRAKR